MTRTLIIAAAFVLTACVNDSPLFVKGFFPLPLECGEVKLGDTQQGGGSLNLATGGSYAIGLKLQSELDPDLDTFGDESKLVGGLHRNTINLDQLNLKYTVVPSSITLEDEVKATWLVIGPGAEAPIILGSLLGEKAIEKLSTSLPNPGDRADIRVRMTLSGNIISGGKVASTAVTYPITIFRGALPTCAAGQIIGRTGPCGLPGGQDGTAVCCADPTAPTECL